MVGGVDVGAVVRGQADALDGPAFRVRQILRPQPLEEALQVGHAHLVVDVLDGGRVARRLGARQVAVQRRGQIDDPACDGSGAHTPRPMYW